MMLKKEVALLGGVLWTTFTQPKEKTHPCKLKPKNVGLGADDEDD